MANSVVRSFMSRLSLWDYLKEIVYIEDPQTVTQVKEAVGKEKEITSIASEIAKTVVRTVSNQEVFTLKNVVFEKQ